jgi:hypothetical protein
MATSTSSSSTSKSKNVAINNDIAAAQVTYLAEVESATSKFVGASSDSIAFKENINKAEEKFLGSMEKVEYGIVQPRGIEKEKAIFIENLTIQIDDRTLKCSEYSVDFQDSGPKIKVISPRTTSP